MSIFCLHFLEKRQYLHGTTLLDCIMNEVPANSKISFKISKIIHSNQITITPLSTENNVHESAASLTWQSDNGKKTLLIIESPPSDKIPRNPFIETLITDLAKINKNSITAVKNSEYNYIKSCISLFKFLLKKIVFPTIDGSWMFTRYDGIIVEDYKSITITLKNTIPNKISSAIICTDNIQIGTLYFSWVEKNTE